MNGVVKRGVSNYKHWKRAQNSPSSYWLLRLLFIVSDNNFSLSFQYALYLPGLALALKIPLLFLDPYLTKIRSGWERRSPSVKSQQQQVTTLAIDGDSPPKYSGIMAWIEQMTPRDSLMVKLWTNCDEEEINTWIGRLKLIFPKRIIIPFIE